MSHNCISTGYQTEDLRHSELRTVLFKILVKVEHIQYVYANKTHVYLPNII